MSDFIEDLSHGGITAHVNWSLYHRVVRRKHDMGEPIHRPSRWTELEARLNAKYQEGRRGSARGGSSHA